MDIINCFGAHKYQFLCWGHLIWWSDIYFVRLPHVCAETYVIYNHQTCNKTAEAGYRYALQKQNLHLCDWKKCWLMRYTNGNEQIQKPASIILCDWKNCWLLYKNCMAAGVKSASVCMCTCAKKSLKVKVREKLWVHHTFSMVINVWYKYPVKG